MNEPSKLMLEDQTLYVLDQGEVSIRALDLAQGTLRTPVRNAAAQIKELTRGPLDTPFGDLAWLDVDDSFWVGPFSQPVGPSFGMAGESAQSVLLTGPDAIRRLNVAGGLLEVVAGRQGGARSEVDGQGGSARLALAGAAIAVHGNTLFIATPQSRSIRAVTRAGEVSTPFRGMAASSSAIGSLAVDATHLYTSVDGTVSRAPRQGGPWQTLPVVFTEDARLLGTLADGRIALIDGSKISFIEPGTFSLSAQRFEQLERIPEFSDALVVVLDPAGGVFFQERWRSSPTATW